MEKGKREVRIIVPRSFEGVLAVAALEEMFLDTVVWEVVYTPHINFQDYQALLPSDVTIVLGHPYRGGILPQEFFTHCDNPMVELIHFATSGEPLPGEHLVSAVHPDRDPVKALWEYLQLTLDQSLLKGHVRFTERTERCVTAANKYRTWTWHDDTATRVFYALYNAAYTAFPKLIKGKSLQDIVKQNATVIKGQLEGMATYISMKKEQTHRTTIDIGGEQATLKVVFADQYINELAHELLDEEPPNAKVIVAVGRATKGSDLFTVRTRNTHAGQFTQVMGAIEGTAELSSFFSTVGYSKLMTGAIQKYYQQKAPAN